MSDCFCCSVLQAHLEHSFQFWCSFNFFLSLQLLLVLPPWVTAQCEFILQLHEYAFSIETPLFFISLASFFKLFSVSSSQPLLQIFSTTLSSLFFSATVCFMTLAACFLIFSVLNYTPPLPLSLNFYFSQFFFLPTLGIFVHHLLQGEVLKTALFLLQALVYEMQGV